MGGRSGPRLAEYALLEFKDFRLVDLEYCCPAWPAQPVRSRIEAGRDDARLADTPGAGEGEEFVEEPRLPPVQPREGCRTRGGCRIRKLTSQIRVRRCGDEML